MKRILLITCMIWIGITSFAQSDSTMKKAVDSICACMSKLNIDDIKTPGEAESAMTNCFLKSNLEQLYQLAEERGIEVSDVEGMHKLGVEIGKELLKTGCDVFLKLSVKLAPGKSDSNKLEDISEKGTSRGVLASVETKDIRKFLLKEPSGKQTSFYWLHYFKDSEKLIDKPEKYIGKTVKFFWQETEIFIPAAKGYFKIKEITGIEGF